MEESLLENKVAQMLSPIGTPGSGAEQPPKAGAALVVLSLRAPCIMPFSIHTLQKQPQDEDPWESDLLGKPSQEKPINDRGK